MVRFDIEPADNGTCLDFLRKLLNSKSELIVQNSNELFYNFSISGFHFTATGSDIAQDACGELEDLPDHLKSGVHGSGLTLDFRSNRINRTKDFFLAVICIDPAPSRKRSVELTSSAAVVKEEPVDSNLQLKDPATESPLAEGLVLSPTTIDCTLSKSLEGSVVGRDPSDATLTSADNYLVSR